MQAGVLLRQLLHGGGAGLGDLGSRGGGALVDGQEHRPVLPHLGIAVVCVVRELHRGDVPDADIADAVHIAEEHVPQLVDAAEGVAYL